VIHRETEIKLPAPEPRAARRLLRQAGFRLARRRAFESNIVFDTPEAAFRGAGALLRVREVNGRGVLTYKAPAAAGKHKSRDEIETAVDSPAALREVLARIGLVPSFRYDKYRTEFTDGEGAAMLDETPIGVYFELEGTPAWIDRAASRLGFAESDYLTASYARLYFEYCRRRGVIPGEMVFSGARDNSRSV
jgi:adenylate cyclase class 2